MAKIVGIDLGTTNSQCAVVEGGRPSIVPSAEGPTYAGKMFPSVVTFMEDGHVLVGEPARRQAALKPDRTVIGIKRKMGTDFKVTVDGKSYTPQEVSARVLRKIKEDASAFLGEEVKQAVITVPAYFNDNQRQATKDAGEIAGLEVLRIINEPTAAALAYGLDKEGSMKVAILDLGGGTFDVTIMEIGEGVFEVLSTSGDTQLGGTDMDQRIVDWIVGEFKGQTGIDLSPDHTAMQRVREAGEKAKIELSSTVTTQISLPFIAQDASGPKNLDMALTRAKLEELIDPVLDQLAPPIRTALSDAKLKPTEVGKIILVGGPTRMPSVRERFKSVLGTEPERGLDPMECVAMGAAIQGAVLAGEIKDVLLLDVTPLTLGIETLGRVSTKLIERNTTIPTRKSQIFSTAADFQTSVEIHVLQGERAMAEDNISLGKFTLVGIPPAPRGVPQIEVTFDIDANGILNVSAKDMATGKEQKMTITASTKLGQEDIDRMMGEAEKYAEEDKKRREMAEVRNKADTVVYTAEKTLKEMGEKISEEQKSSIEAEVKAVRESLESEDVAKINGAVEKLTTVLYETTSKIYQEAGPSPGEGPEAQAGQPDAEQKQGGGGKGKVVDADYEVVDEDKKEE
ncbi:MAG: molecular chaperone DnaK [Theionarchaea archaeon]|nr:molecular chaperone DnaK [Theionarchaea archaeon]